MSGLQKVMYLVTISLSSRGNQCKGGKDGEEERGVVRVGWALIG